MPRFVVGCSLLACVLASYAKCQKPIAGDDLVFAENDGLVSVEAEHFFRQDQSGTRAFYLTSKQDTPNVGKDGDPSHVGGASGGAYLEILPDTRRTHGDKLVRGTNFSPEPGKMAVLSYKVHFETKGRYYVWVRAFSTGSEDNGLHVGIDGTWPDSGQRLQWCQGKHGWRWESKQRTQAQHCGEPHKIFLDIDREGVHEIHFSMREDGFEFDKWLMTTDKQFDRPDGVGPECVVHSGKKPKSFPWVAPSYSPPPAAKPAATNKANVHGGHSNSLRPADNADRYVMDADSFAIEGTGYYLDQGKWLAINPEKRQSAKAGKTFALPTGTYNVTIRTIGENDGQSSYAVYCDDKKIGDYKNPLGTKMYEPGPKFHGRWANVMITEGTVISVESTVGSADGKEYSRARWSAIVFQPADAATKKAAAPHLTAMAAPVKTDRQDGKRTSPTKPVSDKPLIEPRGQDGNGSVEVSGELKRWHAVTVTQSGPFAHEQDNEPNPFTDYRMSVKWTHSDGTTYATPGYFAADGDAGETSAESGNRWRAHFAPDRVGNWTYKVSFVRGDGVALHPSRKGESITSCDGQTGTIAVADSDKSGRDLRAHGRLQYVGKRYLQHAGSKRYFVKAGADAPETLLAFADFDNTVAMKPSKSALKTWQPHVEDWKPGDPTWKGDKGKGLIGAINYLSGKGCNAFSFLTYNAGGDGDNVWPFIHRDDKLHYDCSKLDQWGIVFRHGTERGMYLHFKMQETENDDHKRGKNGNFVPECFDGGELGEQRRLYCRELIARFGHNLALNWNLGEENTQSTLQQKAMIDWISDLDSYGHNIVIHTFPNEQDKVYRPLLGQKSKMTGVSLQNSGIKDTHWQTVKWVEESTKAEKPWVVAFDESGTAAHGQCPDIGYEGYDGRDGKGNMTYTPEDVRRQTLWGTLMGGGAGVEYYFGYSYAQNDLVCEDWRSRDKSWDYCRVAIELFGSGELPIERMQPSDHLIDNPDHQNEKYCLALPGECYLVYLATTAETTLDLTQDNSVFSVSLFDPRTGETKNMDADQDVQGGSKVTLRGPDGTNKDWLLILRKR